MRDLQKSEVQREIPSVLVAVYTQRTDKNVRMFVMAFAYTQTHLCANNVYTLYRANRLLAGEAEERYITRLDKPVQRNILEIRSAIIYYRGSFLRGAPAVPLRRIRRSISARSAPVGVSVQGKKNSIKRTNGGGRSWKNREKCAAGQRTGKTRVQ